MMDDLVTRLRAPRYCGQEMMRASAADEIVRLRTALQNCRMFFDANNRPNHVAMIDAAMDNEQIGGKDGR